MRFEKGQPFTWPGSRGSGQAQSPTLQLQKKHKRAGVKIYFNNPASAKRDPPLSIEGVEDKSWKEASVHQEVTAYRREQLKEALEKGEGLENSSGTGCLPDRVHGQLGAA